LALNKALWFLVFQVRSTVCTAREGTPNGRLDL